MERRTPSQRELLRITNAEERALDGATLDTILDLQRTVERFAGRVERLLGRAITDQGGLARLREGVNVGQQLTAALIDAGLEDVAGLYAGRFNDVEVFARDYFTSWGFEPTRGGLDTYSLSSFVRFQEAAFLDLADARIVDPLRSAVMEGVVGNWTRKETLEHITDVMRERNILTRAGEGFTDHQIETLVNDGFRRYNREVKRQKAQALGFDVVWYQGPLDKKTRDQCRAMLTESPNGVPNMWHIEDFTADLHPDLDEDPLVAGGGFNCRHTVSIIPASYAISRGFEPNRGYTTDTEIEQRAEGVE